MTEWHEVSLGELVELHQADVRTGPFGTQLHASDYTQTGVPVLNVRNLGYGGIRRVEVDLVDAAVQERLSTHVLRENDIVFGRKGAVDRHALIRSAEAGWMQGSDCIRLRLGEGAPITPAFLSMALLTPTHQAWMQAQCSHGATMASLNQEIISRIQLVAPNLASQNRITAVLAAYDELIVINERRIELLEDLARSLYREWFVRFRFPGWDNVPFADTPFGPVPADWQVDRLARFVRTQYGFTASATTEPVGPRFLRGMDINKRSFTDWSKVPYCEVTAEQLERFRLEVGDVCVVRMADPGKVGIVERPVNAVFASYLVRLRSVDPRLPPQLLAHYLRDDRYQDWVTGSSTGTTRKSASAAVLTEPLIVLPPVALADRFERDCSVLRSILNGLLEENAALAQTRDLLLPRLVTGRLDITDVDLGDLLREENTA
ncbi:MAG: restriction endonuclease subunit S [Actinobacteria bacterium]|nr:restriction endonuclease subunit S [Actinomycetota bacterium]